MSWLDSPWAWAVILLVWLVLGVLAWAIVHGGARK